MKIAPIDKMTVVLLVTGMLVTTGCTKTSTFHAFSPLGPAEVKLKVIEERREDACRILVVEPPQILPEAMDPSRPAAYWTAWPDSRQDPFRRACNPSFYLASPSGTFYLEVFPAFVEEPAQKFRPAILSYFAFDPEKKAPLDWIAFLDMPSQQTLQILRKKNLLTDQQLKQLGEKRRAFEERYAILMEKWQAFSKKPREASLRRAFFYALGVVFPPNDCEPETFCSPSQRSELRRDGMTIVGRIRHDGYADGTTSSLYRFTFLTYPLAQLVADWNSGRILKFPGAPTCPEPKPTIFLKVRPDRQYEEVPAGFEILDNVLLNPAERQQRILDKFLAIEGIEIKKD